MSHHRMFTRRPLLLAGKGKKKKKSPLENKINPTHKKPFKWFSGCLMRFQLLLGRVEWLTGTVIGWTVFSTWLGCMNSVPSAARLPRPVERESAPSCGSRRWMLQSAVYLYFAFLSGITNCVTIRETDAVEEWESKQRQVWTGAAGRGRGGRFTKIRSDKLTLTPKCSTTESPLWPDRALKGGTRILKVDPGFDGGQKLQRSVWILIRSCPTKAEWFLFIRFIIYLMAHSFLEPKISLFLAIFMDETISRKIIDIRLRSRETWTHESSPEMEQFMFVNDLETRTWFM